MFSKAGMRRRPQSWSRSLGPSPPLRPAFRHSCIAHDEPVYSCPEAPPRGLQFSLFHNFFCPEGVEWPSSPAYCLGFPKWFLHFNLWTESVWTRFCFLTELAHEGAIMFANSIPSCQEASWRCHYLLLKCFNRLGQWIAPGDTLVKGIHAIIYRYFSVVSWTGSIVLTTKNKFG